MAGWQDKSVRHLPTCMHVTTCSKWVLFLMHPASMQQCSILMMRLCLWVSKHPAIELSTVRFIDLSIFRLFALSIFLYRSVDLSIFRLFALSIFRYLNRSIFRSLHLSFILDSIVSLARRTQLTMTAGYCVINICRRCASRASICPRTRDSESLVMGRRLRTASTRSRNESATPRTKPSLYSTAALSFPRGPCQKKTPFYLSMFRSFDLSIYSIYQSFDLSSFRSFDT